MIVALALALSGSLFAPDESTIVTAASASIPARDVTLVPEGGELVLKYTDSAGRAQSLKAADVVELTMSQKAGPQAKPATEDLEFLLTTGDLLVGRAGAKSPDGIILTSRVYGSPLVKFTQIRTITFPANRDFRPKQLPAKADTSDILFTKTGDRSTGTLQALSDGGIVFHSEKRDVDVSYPAQDVAAILLMETEKAPAEPNRPFAAVLTTDGSSVRGEILSLSEGVLRFKDLFGQERKVASNQVAGVYMKNGRVVYLSDLDPSTVSEDANFIRGSAKLSSDLEFPWQRDRSARGTELVLAGTHHRKGLGVRAYSSLTFALGGAYKRFQATLGLDAVSRGLAAIAAEVWVDGKKVKDFALKGNDAPQAIDVDVADGKELKLVVTWAGNGQSDFVDWGSARLVR